jgi:hypothetical protein
MDTGERSQRGGATSRFNNFRQGPMAAWGCDPLVGRALSVLGTIIEQDHRAIKRRCAAMGGGGFESFGVPQLRWQVSIAPIGFVRGNSRSGGADIGTSGHSSKSGTERSRSTLRKYTRPSAARGSLRRHGEM